MQTPGSTAAPAQRADRPRGSRWRGALARLTADREELQAQDTAERAAAMGGTPCSLLSGRHRANVSGTLRTVTLRPRAGVPALEAELFDGTGTLSVIWLGRREIAGITPGAAVRIEGFVSCVEGTKTCYNPRYEIVPAPVA